MGVETYHGSCTCGAVRFRVDVDLAQGASRCNCTVCTKTSQLGSIVKPDAFTLLTEASALSMYEREQKMSQRYFCSTCGVQVFGRGHLDVLGGDFVSFNVNCLDDVELNDIAVVYWDGRHNNWQAGPRPEPWPIL